MALKTKADYEKAGAIDAAAAQANCLVSDLFPQHGTSWQAIAYWRGRRSHRQAPPGRTETGQGGTEGGGAGG